jgi:hypothetical protein
VGLRGDLVAVEKSYFSCSSYDSSDVEPIASGSEIRQPGRMQPVRASDLVQKDVVKHFVCYIVLNLNEQLQAT